MGYVNPKCALFRCRAKMGLSLKYSLRSTPDQRPCLLYVQAIARARRLFSQEFSLRGFHPMGGGGGILIIIVSLSVYVQLLLVA